MDKITYLAELAEGLARWVPERERQDILRYYAEYFAEAGPGKEAEVIQELGDPWALSCRLAVEGGFVTQEAANSWIPQQSRRKKWPWMLAVGLTAVVLVFTVTSAAFMASRIGRFVGQMAGYSENEATVAADPEWMVEDVGFAAVEDISGIAFYEYEPEMSSGFWTMEDGCLDAFSVIDADISLGNVTVTGGEDYTLFIQMEGDLGGYKLDWAVKNGTLKIRDGSSESHRIGLEGLESMLEKKTVDVVITVPRLEHLDRLTVKTQVGNVFLAELFVEGNVSAESDTGDVGCYEVQTMKKLSLAADVGDIMLGLDRPYEGMEMELESDVGNVEASLGCWEAECAYELEADVGTISVNGRNCGTQIEHKVNSAACKLSVESDVGDINVYFYKGQRG